MRKSNDADPQTSTAPYTYTGPRYNERASDVASRALLARRLLDDSPDPSVAAFKHSSVLQSGKAALHLCLLSAPGLKNKINK